MADKTFQDAFLAALRDSFDAEHQLVKALPKMAEAAENPDLKAAFESHLEETKGHVQILTRVFELLDETPKGQHCDGIAGIVKEGGAALDEGYEPATLDACLIAGGQRAEHYEIAAYGTLIAWAKVLGEDQVASLFAQILEQEKAANAKLSALAEDGINEEASRGAADEGGENAASPSRANGLKH